MFKTSLMAASMAVLVLSPVFGGTQECTEAHMKQMDSMIAKMTDAAKKRRRSYRHVQGCNEEGRHGGMHKAYGAGSQSHGPLIQGE